MPDIRYVCLSDTHFGADNSLLTYLGRGRRSADPMRTSPVLEQLVRCLRALVATNEGRKKPTLVLNGDILELALTTDERAAMAFERFLDLAFPAGGDDLFDKRVHYLPGNHDHHLWETAREGQYLDYIGDVAKCPPDKPINPPWHATNLFVKEDDPDPCPASFLNTLARRRGRSDVSFATAYPNFGLVSGDQERAVIFTHGHFAESKYTLVSNLMTVLFPERVQPTHVWEVEEENFAWIDFFWSALGRSGPAGGNVELIYDKLQSQSALAALLENVAYGLAQNHRLPVLGETMTAWSLNLLLRPMVRWLASAEVQQTDVQLSETSKATLKRYLQGPLRAQVLSERPRVPSEVTVVFGHTHKPFEQVESYDGFAEKVKLYNSGGWVVDSEDSAKHPGWAVILIDESLNTASLRLAKRDSVGTDTFAIGQAAEAGAPPNPLHDRLLGLVDATRAPWSDFLTVLQSSATDHLENLKAKISNPA